MKKDRESKGKSVVRCLPPLCRQSKGPFFRERRNLPSLSSSRNRLLLPIPTRTLWTKERKEAFFLQGREPGLSRERVSWVSFLCDHSVLLELCAPCLAHSLSVSLCHPPVLALVLSSFIFIFPLSFSFSFLSLFILSGLPWYRRSHGYEFS